MEKDHVNKFDMDDLFKKMDEAQKALDDVEGAYLAIEKAVKGFQNDEDSQELYDRLTRVQAILEGK